MMKHKYKFGNGLAHLEGRDVKMLEDMAAQGYAFVKVSKWGFYKFQTSQPEECAYAIDFSDISAKDEGFQQYIEIFTIGGWEYITSLENIHYFKAPVGTTPIYTDGSSMADKYDVMRKMCIWWVVGSGTFAVICAALYIIFSSWLLWPLGGAAIGLCITMYQGMLLNKRRAAQLREGMVVNEACGYDEVKTANDYEELSKRCGKSFVLSIVLTAGMTGLFFILWIIGIRPYSGLESLLIGIVSIVWLLSIIHAISKAYGFFTNKRKAAKLSISKS